MTAPGAGPGAGSGEGGEARRRSGRRQATGLLLVLAAALGLTLVPTWVRTSADTALQGVVDVSVSGTQAAPAVAAVAVVLLAAAAAVGLVGRIGRWVVVAVVGVGGAIVVASAVAVVTDPESVARDVVRATTGVARLAGPATLTFAPYLATGLGAAVVLAAGWLAVSSSRWSRPSRRHEVAGGAGPGTGPDDDQSAWDALSRGDDPT